MSHIYNEVNGSQSCTSFGELRGKLLSIFEEGENFRIFQHRIHYMLLLAVLFLAIPIFAYQVQWPK